MLAPYLSRSWPAAAWCAIYLQHQDYGQAEHYLDDLMHLMVRQWDDAPGYLDCSATLADAVVAVAAVAVTAIAAAAIASAAIALLLEPLLQYLLL